MQTDRGDKSTSATWPGAADRWLLRALLVASICVASSEILAAQGAPAPHREEDTSSNARVVASQASYSPVKPNQRAQWFVVSTVGAESLTSGLLTAAIGTARDHPSDYGAHWEGFADRYGMRFTGLATGNALEASVGALWGEDPRYIRATDRRFKSRIGNVLVLTFLADRRDGHRAPAYARYLAISGNNFLSNTWRTDSEATNGDAAWRTVWGFVGRMGSNAFAEFWPNVKTRLHRKNQP